MDAGLSVFRFRIQLNVTHDVRRLHAIHAPTLYALLSEAFGTARSQPPALPDGTMIDAPEQCRVQLDAGEKYAFGFSLLAPSPDEAQRIVADVVRGLRHLGRSQRVAGAALGGNYSVALIQDLVAGSTWDKNVYPTPIPADHFEHEINQLRDGSDGDMLKLTFTTPLRMSRPKPDRRRGHAFFDRVWFCASRFVQRVMERASRLHINGYQIPVDYIEPCQQDTLPVDVSENRLVWLDVSYGKGKERKSLGGARGELVLSTSDPEVRRALVYGQYLGAGESTRFGFGRYRIDNLGAHPFACRRRERPLDLIYQSGAVDRAVHEYNLPSGRVRRLIQQIRRGTYRPREHFRIAIPAGRSGSAAEANRTLMIPQREDRALQRAVHEWLAPALDRFFEDSSLAYRRGLGRHRAAQHVQRAYRAGYVWGVKADVHQFFDSVSHEVLRERLDVYVSDDELVKLLMTWVECCTSQAGCGLPTGAPISPLLSNLTLDQFDERIAAEDARLVRYADDFMILVRSREDAVRLQAAAAHEAAQLRLALNAEKTRVLHLHEPFEFLGYRFEKIDQWEITDTAQPRHLRDLGWFDTSRNRQQQKAVNLAGEKDASPPQERSATIIGPGVEWVGLGGGHLLFSRSRQAPRKGPRIDHIDFLVAMGPPTLASDFVQKAVGDGLDVFLTNDWGEIQAVLQSGEAHDSARLISALVLAAHDGERSLKLSQQLTAAKLRNHAALALAVSERCGKHGDVCLKAENMLRESAVRCLEMDSKEKLRGLEGAGAARWYEVFGRALGKGFRFEKRVAPRADDPVNVVLNITQTLLHRYIEATLTRFGFPPSLGLFHAHRIGHAALASDIQEPFRHLMDRATIRVLDRLKPGDFQKTKQGPFPLRIRPSASVLVMEHVQRELSFACLDRFDKARTYRQHVAATIKSLRRHLLQPDQPWEVFEHP